MPDPLPPVFTPPIRTAAIVSTGDELLSGRTVDTNATYIADRLSAIGLDVVCKLAVGDYVDRIAWAWGHALDRADVVVSTGGLGPTVDDLTTEALAGVAAVALVRNDEEEARIRAIFERRGRVMPENNLTQADIPEGAEIVPNASGTAAGYRLMVPRGERRPIAIVLPGVPREMKPMLDEHVVPWLAEHGDAGLTNLSRTFQTFGLPESSLDELLTGAVPAERGRIAFRASFPKISVRVSVSGDAAAGVLDELSAEVRARLGSAIYAEGEGGMEDVVGALLTKAGKTLATAESCSGGLIGSRITDVAGSSEYYVGGLVAYSNDLKQRYLGVASETLERFGAVSEETAREMACGACRMTGADIAVATTGIAGPGGGTAEKPVGTVAIALAERRLGGTPSDSPSEEIHAVSRIYRLWGGRDWVKTLTSQVALDWIRRHLLGMDPLEADFGLDGKPRLDPLGNYDERMRWKRTNQTSRGPREGCAHRRCVGHGSLFRRGRAWCCDRRRHARGSADASEVGGDRRCASGLDATGGLARDPRVSR